MSETAGAAYSTGFAAPLYSSSLPTPTPPPLMPNSGHVFDVPAWQRDVPVNKSAVLL